MEHRRAVMAAVVTLLLLVGCGTDPGDPDRSPALQPQTSLPAANVTVFTSEDAVELAVAMSRALYDRAPLVVLAGGDDAAGQHQAADLATRLGVPLLLTPAGPEQHDALRQELTRLSAATALAIGEAATQWAGGLELELEVVPTAPSTPVPPAEALRALAVLTPEAPHTVAATATARAAGARVLLTDATDPRRDRALIATLGSDPPTHTVALGAGYGPADLLERRLAVAATGVELPGGGQVVFPDRRFVALYGHPGDTGLGALGEQPLDAAIARVRQVAAEYEALTDGPVVPTFEIITTVASAAAGPHGDYSRRTPVEQLRPWIDAARDAGVYVVLDLQPGHTDFLTQAQEYEEILREPHVGLALDPEWRLAPGQRHMVQIGSVDATEVNKVIGWLADLTARHRLPQKLLILHQFTLRMITNRATVDTGRDEVAVLIHADGFGTPAAKYETWRALHGDPPPDVWWGWKNFYDEDRPTLTPAQTVAVEPSPRFISYQ